MELSKGLIKADIIMAKQAIDLFKSKSIKEIKNQAAYHLQQATEKLIKIQIYQSNVSYHNKALYTHNISSLIAYAESLDFGVIIPEYIRNKAIHITDWEAGSRYDLHFSIRIDTLEKCYEEVNEWYTQIIK